MSKEQYVIKAGSTDVSLPVLLLDAYTGEPKTGLTETNLDLQWIRVETDNDVTLEAKHDLIALATPALTDPHLDYGCEEIGLGYYRVDLPDGIFAAGARQVRIAIYDGAAAAILQKDLIVDLVAYDPADSVRLGLTALPNAAADAAGGLPISDAGGLDLDAKLANTNEITAARMGALTDWINGGRLDLLIDGIKVKTDYLPSANPGAANGLVICGTNAPILFTGSGNAFAAVSTGGDGAGMYVEGNTGGHGLHAKGGNGIASSGFRGETAGTGAGWYGTLASGTITSTSFASGAITAEAIATDAIDADALKTDAITEIVNAIAAYTGVLPEGTVTLAQVLKIIAAAVAGDVKDKDGGGYNIYSPDNGTTVVFTAALSATTPYRDTTLS